MNATLTIPVPFLTAYDPPVISEGTLDPLGLYQIADQLATRLVPGVRERMQRVRFLTAIAVGALVTEDLEGDPERPDSSPFMVWEWLVVEAIMRCRAEHPGVWGVPGSLVAKRALSQHGYLDARSYLKTARIFGFHGVYKRLAIHTSLVDPHLGARAECERLVDAWARGLGYSGIEDWHDLRDKWRAAVRRSLGQDPPRTRTGFQKSDWEELADTMLPSEASRPEKRRLRELLNDARERQLGALPLIWNLQSEFQDKEYREEVLHRRLEEQHPELTTLLVAIRDYERFCRSLQDAFDILRAEAGIEDARGFDVTSVARDPEFAQSVAGLDQHFERTRQSLAELDLEMVALFEERFGPFSEPMAVADCAVKLCDHHDTVQKQKSETGKRAWFDRLGRNRIYMRQAYRIPRRSIEPDRYVHDYRGRPIRNFYFDVQ